MKKKAEELGKHIYRHNCDETTAGELILAFVKEETRKAYYRGIFDEESKIYPRKFFEDWWEQKLKD